MINQNQLIFIFALPRSGSTLLQKLLVSNENIKSTPEPWLLLPLIEWRNQVNSINPRVNRIKSDFNYNHSLIAIREFIQELPHQEKTLDDSISKLLLSIYGSLLADGGYFIDKTPRYYWIAKELMRILPNATYILLTRDLRSNYASIRKTWFRGGHIKTKYHQSDILTGPKMLYSAFNDNTPKNFYKVRYEDLILNTQDTVNGIFKYLDLEPQENIALKSSLKGKLGDKTGEEKFKDTISDSRIHSWHEVFNTWYDQWLLKDYLSKLDPELLAFFHTPRGIEKKEIKKIGILSFLDHKISFLLLKLNIWEFVLSIKSRLKGYLK